MYGNTLMSVTIGFGGSGSFLGSRRFFRISSTFTAMIHPPHHSPIHPLSSYGHAAVVRHRLDHRDDLAHLGHRANADVAARQPFANRRNHAQTRAGVVDH